MSKKNLPTISDPHQLTQQLKVWQQKLGKLVKNGQTPRIPWNFRLTPQRGAILVQWAKNSDGSTDGYEITWTSDGDFSKNVNAIPIPSPLQEAYLHSIQIQGATLPTIYYRIRATGPGQDGAHSIKSLDSATLSAAPLDPSDNVTTPTTTYDQGTNDDLQSFTGGGRYQPDYV